MQIQVFHFNFMNLGRLAATTIPISNFSNFIWILKLSIFLGCFCVYSDVASFEYIRSSLEKTLLSNLEKDDGLPFQVQSHNHIILPIFYGYKVTTHTCSIIKFGHTSLCVT